jgi:hypothetical protein
MSITFQGSVLDCLARRRCGRVGCKQRSNSDKVNSTFEGSRRRIYIAIAKSGKMTLLRQLPFLLNGSTVTDRRQMKHEASVFIGYRFLYRGLLVLKLAKWVAHKSVLHVRS